MQNKLQELTDRLYAEGLTKGKEEGARILEEARKQADDIVARAKAEAAEITAEAQKNAEALKEKVASDLKMAATQSIQATKKDVEKLVISRMADEKVKSAMSSADFIKGIITEVARKFNAEEAMDLALVLPDALKAELEPFVKNELAASLKGGVSASFSKKIAGGFTIGPKDGGYFISLTDETMDSLISEYLRPVTRKLLFG